MPRFEDIDADAQMSCVNAEIYRLREYGERKWRDRYPNPYRLARRLVRRYRRQNDAPTRMHPIYVVVQSISRHYGGPEEGGWWYDFCNTEEVHTVWGWQDARRLTRQLQEEYGQPRFNRYSAANRGAGDIRVYPVAFPAEFEANETREIPTYW